jgi:catechol 2,3-dioxygenase-like lactoylglutathione lyase family enzyme
MAKPADSPRWRGIHHLALITPDMDATVRFYHGVLGMRLVATLMAGPMRHYFFEMGPENTVAFFEWQGVPTFAKPAGVRVDEAMQFDHLSFNLPDELALYELRDRLLAAGVEITEVVDHDIMHSVYFTDPNGIALEASWWVVDATGRTAVYDDGRLFSDPDPVPAARELAEAGELAWMPQTHLTGEPILDPS